jgi:hypothetical protein
MQDSFRSRKIEFDSPSPLAMAELQGLHFSLQNIKTVKGFSETPSLFEARRTKA